MENKCLKVPVHVQGSLTDRIVLKQNVSSMIFSNLKCFFHYYGTLLIKFNVLYCKCKQLLSYIIYFKQFFYLHIHGKIERVSIIFFPSPSLDSLGSNRKLLSI